MSKESNVEKIKTLAVELQLNNVQSMWLVSKVEALITSEVNKAKLDQEEMTLRYCIVTLQDTGSDFSLENFDRQLDKNLRAQEELATLIQEKNK